MTLEQVLEAIDDLYKDRSFSVQEALDNLTAIQDKIEPLMDGLRADVANQSDGL